MLSQSGHAPSGKDAADPLEQCIEFLQGIGIPVIMGPLPSEGFLPGLFIMEGKIMLDPETLKYPGDILHEAGHIAVVPASDRGKLNAATISGRKDREAEEMMAIAWSYAACMHIGLDPYFVFHEAGYRGGGEYIAEAFRDKKYIGLPMLEWIGLTAGDKKARKLQVAPFPHMLRWLRA